MGNFRKQVKKIILSLIPRSLKRMIINSTFQHDGIDISNIHFSQEGEDVILDKFFFDKPDGFYVDIGAHHPVRLSNTYKYYLKGWRGINIDAMPGVMQLFNEIRSRDINLEIGIGKSEAVLPFYSFEESTLNTFNEDNIKRITNSGIKVRKIINIPVMPLYAVLDKYLPGGQTVDFMSIDVEGLDYDVLLSNNWDKYKPKVILVENIDAAIEEVLQSEIHLFLSSKGYRYVSKTFHTNIYAID
jgi:FkbM family methyltransferase